MRAKIKANNVGETTCFSATFFFKLFHWEISNISRRDLDKENTSDIPQILSSPFRQNNDRLFSIRDEC